ncbi:hydrolase [Actinoplanes sp. L3-i22]|uniref:Vgb family protein n=1 Tax=Actinoplanes sp. L3-i22 TaxID=2836373 RepID=UPI001C752CB6|nr:hydrolase [Actinoplanes sp. L3-i22]BCY10225.1 virginiamycin B lyase [Actinoplanes sp. L3-i22]
MPTLPSGWTPYAVTGDATGTIWTTLLKPHGLGRISTTSEIHLEPLTGQPMLLATAPDGALWYTRTDDKLGRRDPSGSHTTINVTPGSSPYGIAVTTPPHANPTARPGDVWFTAAGTNQIVRVSGGETAITIDLPLPDSRPAMLTIDGDGAPWAALNGAAALARVRPDDTVDLVELPTGSAPVGITASTDGIWYADIARGLAGRISRSGSIDEFPFPDPACRPHAVAPDPAGGCWVTLWGSTELARITTDGKITLHKLPGEEPHGLWVSPTHVWVAMESGAVVSVERSPAP